MVCRFIVGLLILLNITPVYAAGGLLVGSPPAGGGIAELAPSAGWTQTADSGGCTTTESATLRGSNWVQKAIGNFADYPYKWIENSNDGYYTVGAVSGDRGGIENVVFCLEGTSTTVTSQTVNPVNGAIGWTVHIASRNGASGNGDAVLYAAINPVNGYQRLVSIPVTLNTNPTNAISRAQFYVNFATGVNPANCAGAGSTNGTLAAPWKNIIMMGCATSGAVVNVAAGTYVEDSNTVPGGSVVNNARMISVRASGSVTITRTARTSPEGRWSVRAARAEFDGVTVDLSKMVLIEGSFTDGRVVFKNSTLADPNGAVGPTYGYAASPVEESQLLFNVTNGLRIYIVESSITNYVTTGAFLYRNVTATASADTIFMSSEHAGMRVFDFVATLPGEHKARKHTEENLIFASAVFTAGSVSYEGVPCVGCTEITWSGSPTLQDIDPGGASATALTFLTGPLVGAGPSTEAPGSYDYFCQNSTGCPNISVVEGNASGAAVGNLAWGWTVFHSDSLQMGGQLTGSINPDNIYYQCYRVAGVTNQPIFLQAGPANSSINVTSVTTSGTTLTKTGHPFKVDDFVRLKTGAQAGQYRRVASVTDTDHVELASAFSADQSQDMFQIKTIKGLGIVNSIIANTNGALLSQFQNGVANFAMIQSTLPGAGQAFVRNPTSPMGSFGWEAFSVLDSIWPLTTAESGTYPTEINFDNNQFMSGTPRGTNATVGTVTFDANYQPTAGLTKTMLGKTGASQPLVPFDCSGNPISNSHLVGAPG